MSRLISDLLEYSRFANENELPHPPIDAGEVARSAVSNLQQRIAETEASVTIDDLPVVLSDNQLMRVFQNLVGYAWKYRSEAAPAIHISARPEGPAWIFEARDNGIGFEMKHAER